MKYSKTVVIGIIVGSLLCSLTYLVGSLLISMYFRLGQLPKKPVLSRITESAPGLEELWSHSNIINRGDKFSMVAAQKTVFLLGETTILGVGTVIAIDGSDGKTVLWQDKGPSLNGQNILYATSSALYVGSSGQAYMTAYSPRTGDILWSQRLIPAERGVNQIQVSDNKIFISASNFEFIIQADTGQILASDYFLPSANTAYFSKGVLTENILLVRGANVVRAIDRKTDKELWKIENVASNPAVTPAVVYLLTIDGKLLSLDLQTGTVLATIQFDAPSFGYVAVDQDVGLLYIYLYESEQLFAFKIIDYSSNE